MTISSVGTPTQIVGAGPLTVSSQSVGNVWLLAIACTSSTLTATGVSGGGAVSWTHLAGPYYVSGVGTSVDLWMGPVVSGGPNPTSISVTYSGSTSGVRIDLAAEPFSSSLSSSSFTWTSIATGTATGTGSTGQALPSLTGTGAYFAYVYPSSASFTGGSGTGFTFNADSDGCGEIWNTAVTGTSSPTFTASGSTPWASVGVIFQDTPLPVLPTLPQTSIAALDYTPRAALERAIDKNEPLRLTLLADWTPDRGKHWYPFRVIKGTGQHASDRTQQYRWNFTGQFASDYNLGPNGIHPYGCRVRLRQQFDVMGFGSVIVDAGRYIITSARQIRGITQVQGVSYEQDVIDSILPVPRTFPSRSRMSMKAQAELLVTEAVSDASFIWDSSLNYGQTMPALASDQDRWSVVDGATGSTSIMAAMGGEMYCNEFGAFQAVPVPSIDDDPVWTLRYGATLSTQSSSTPALEYTRDKVNNLIVVTGTAADGSTPTGPYYAWDNDPSSFTYAGPDPVHKPHLAGFFGVKPLRYSSPLVQNGKQGGVVAHAQLQNYLGVHKVLTADATVNPFLQAGRNILVVNPEDGSSGVYLLDAVTTYWGTGRMTLVTRTPKEDL